MPKVSKRKLQLQRARASKIKRRKLSRSVQNEVTEDDYTDIVSLARPSAQHNVSRPAEDLASETSADNGNDESDMEHIVEDSNDLETDGESDIFEVYSKDYIDGLHRDDVRAIVIILTVREWRTTFIANDGTFLDTLQGKYQRTGILWQNEELNKKASKFVRENAFVKGKPNMTFSSFTKWVNQCLLPNYSLEPGYPRNVSIETGRRWLHNLGFSVLDAKKGTYVDGHEREDVISYRKHFLRKMVALGLLSKENAPTEEAQCSLPDDLESPSPLVLNETVFFVS